MKIQAFCLYLAHDFVNLLLQKQSTMPLSFSELRTPRLILRELSPPVVRHLFNNHTGPEIFHLLGCGSEQDYQAVKERYWINFIDNPRLSFRTWLLIDPKTNGLIGDCSFHSWWVRHQYAEAGYGIWDDLYKGKGLMSEALERVLEVGFREMKLQRVEAFVVPGNKPSIRILQKFGFRREGFLRRRFNNEGRMENTLAFSLLPEEFEGRNTPMGIKELVAGFENRSLPSTAWTHEAHLSVGLWYILEYGLDVALCRIRPGIIAYNLASGGENTPDSGYHETLTIFWMRILHRFVQENAGSRRYETIRQELFSSFYADKELPLKYYSREVLFSARARGQWVEPNLKAL